MVFKHNMFTLFERSMSLVPGHNMLCPTIPVLLYHNISFIVTQTAGCSLHFRKNTVFSVFGGWCFGVDYRLSNWIAAGFQHTRGKVTPQLHGIAERHHFLRHGTKYKL